MACEQRSRAKRARDSVVEVTSHWTRRRADFSEIFKNWWRPDETEITVKKKQRKQFEVSHCPQQLYHGDVFCPDQILRYFIVWHWNNYRFFLFLMFFTPRFVSAENLPRRFQLTCACVEAAGPPLSSQTPWSTLRPESNWMTKRSTLVRRLSCFFNSRCFFALWYLFQ